ncbi:hypothetical protein CRYUN_Cryun20dG0030200 [Craigia yunnanensis]
MFFELDHSLITLCSKGCFITVVCSQSKGLRADHESKFDALRAVKEGCPILCTGEMIFPWLFDEVHALRPFEDAAHLLAEKEDWTPLYDIAALKNNKVSVAAAVYYEDMYVNFKLVMETASQIAGIWLWITMNTCFWAPRWRRTSFRSLNGDANWKEAFVLISL